MNGGAIAADGGCWRWQLLAIAAADFKYDFHIMRSASSSVLLMYASRRARRCGHEVVVLSRLEFESARLRRERSERDGEVHELMWLITDGDDSRIAVDDAARVVFFFRNLRREARQWWYDVSVCARDRRPVACPVGKRETKTVGSNA